MVVDFRLYQLVYPEPLKKEHKGQLDLAKYAGRLRYKDGRQFIWRNEVKGQQFSEKKSLK